jgi:signal transduction histidine kinase/DNA-binding response OmpR family regulator
MKQSSAIDNWFTWLVFHQNDSPELIIRKKFFLTTNLVALFFISILLIVAYSLDLKNFANYVSMLLAFTLIQTILLLIIRKWSRWFVYSVFSLFMVLIFYIIVSLGGIANSAGILMAAYFFLLTSQWMEDAKLLVLIGVLFVIGVLVAGISYPYLKIDESLFGWKNNLFFAINFGWIGLLLAVALYFTIVKSENTAKNRAEQLQELDLLKSRLYANIAHEFRTPLTLIKGKAEEIGEHHDDETTDKANSIIQNSDKILALINQMLNLSRIEEGAMPVRYVQTDLVAFIRAVVNSFQGYADLQKIGLHFESQYPQLMMDIETEKLEESLLNLLSNAIKYTPEYGEVHVTIRKLNPYKELGPQVEICVRDTGIGIPEDQHDKIFIRFYRIQDDRYPYQEGTGIGLTLVNEYVKLMNGSMRVSSFPGDGSEFIIVLPITQNAEIENEIHVKNTFKSREVFHTSHISITESGYNLPHLLIIEDNIELVEFLTGLLKSEYQIFTAENGTLGVENAIAFIPDIILSDVMMPGKDGYQVCKELKNDFRTNHIPLVLLTARADIDSRILGLELGADAYLTKPFDKKELITCLNNLFVQREKLRLKYQSNLFKKLPEEQVGGLNEKFLNKTIKILEQNYGNESFHLEDLYLKLGISRVQLHRKLTALTKQSTSSFIRNFRLQKACNLMLKTDKNVSEIAYSVGIANPNYFTRVFTHEYGMSPTEFRKSIT